MRWIRAAAKRIPGARRAICLARYLKRAVLQAEELDEQSGQFKLLRSNVRNLALAVVALEQERHAGAAPAREIASAEQIPNLNLRSTLCRQKEFMTPEYLYWCRQIKESPVWHRKQWEYCFIAQALWERGLLKKGRRGCGFGVGREPLPALFASLGCTILATDAPLDGAIEGQWGKTGQYAGSLEALNGRGIASQETFFSNVTYRPVDMNKMPADLKEFDFVWSACAMEHLGDIEKGIRFLLDSCRCLKPGGVGVHTTEFNLSSDEKTIGAGPVALFRRKDIEDIGARLREAGCSLLPVDFDPGGRLLDKFVALPPYEFSSSDAPHLRIVVGDYVATSLGLIVHKADGDEGRAPR